MFIGKKEMPKEFCQMGSVKYFYFYHFIILRFIEHSFHWKTIWDIFQNLWASEPHRVFHENDSSIFSTFILRLSRNSRDPLCDKTFFFLHSYWRCMQSPIYFLSSCRVINKFRQILKILSPARHVNYFLLFTYSSIQLIV